MFNIFFIVSIFVFICINICLDVFIYDCYILHIYIIYNCILCIYIYIF